MVTKTTQVARALDAGYMFNDKLKDGRRSLKVWSWKDKQYALAKELLEARGCKVELIVLSRKGNGYRPAHNVTRLHVTE